MISVPDRANTRAKAAAVLSLRLSNGPRPTPRSCPVFRLSTLISWRQVGANPVPIAGNSATRMVQILDRGRSKPQRSRHLLIHGSDVHTIASAVGGEGDGMRRRNYGSGGLRRRGKRWQATLWLPRDPITHKRTRKTFTGGTKKEALERRSAVQASDRAWPRRGGCAVRARRVLRTLAARTCGSIGLSADSRGLRADRACLRCLDRLGAPVRAFAHRTSRRPSRSTCSRGQASARPPNT